MVKAQVKKYTPAMTKIRGAITSTTKNIELNPALSADDFNYAVPRGVRLTPMPVARNPNGTAGGHPDRRLSKRNSGLFHCRTCAAYKR